MAFSLFSFNNVENRLDVCKDGAELPELHISLLIFTRQMKKLSGKYCQFLGSFVLEGRNMKLHPIYLKVNLLRKAKTHTYHLPIMY